MKVTVSRDDLARAVSFVKTNALPKNATPPVMAGIRVFVFRGGLLGLAAFDYDQCARAEVQGTDATGGDCLVPGAEFAKAVASLPKGKKVRVTLSADTQAGLTLDCAPVKITLRYMPADEYPQLPSLPPDMGEVDGDLFALACARVCPCATTDWTLPSITHVHLYAREDGLEFAATDRYRLAANEIPWLAGPHRPSAGNELVIPVDAKLLGRVGKLAAKAKVSVHHRPGNDEDGTQPFAGFAGDWWSLTVRCPEFEFVPQWRKRIDQATNAGDVKVDGTQLGAAIKRAEAVMERAEGVTLRPAADGITVVVERDGEVVSSELVTAEVPSDLATTFNANPVYLREIVQHVPQAIVGWPARKGDLISVRSTETSNDYRAILVTLRPPGS